MADDAGASAPPTFSVVIPAYQAATTVAGAIRSALDQTTPAQEVIVCDDGSTDGLDRALEPYADRVTVLRKEHGGAASARNHGLRAASGDFVVYLDSDDVLLARFIESLAELGAAQPDLDLLSTDAMFEVDGQVAGRFYEENRFETDDQRTAIIHSCFVGWPAARRERLLAAGGFDESLVVAHDWDAWMRLILDGARAGLVAEPLLRYRVGPGSLTAARAASLRERVTVLAKVARDPSLTREERATLAEQRRTAERRALFAETREAVVERRGEARRRGLALAVARNSGLRGSVLGAAAVLAPGLVGQLLERRGAAEDDRLPSSRR
jgi:hypothetical protein